MTGTVNQDHRTKQASRQNMVAPHLGKVGGKAVGNQETALLRAGLLKGWEGPGWEPRGAGKAGRRGRRSLARETVEQRLGWRKWAS